MKKLFFLFFLGSISVVAQYAVKGTMQPPNSTNWLILYKVEGARQKFIANTEAKTSFVEIEGKKVKVANFNFTLPKDTASGFYRISYDYENGGFVDFIFNNENVDLAFNPKFASQSLLFNASDENMLYASYLSKVGKAQQQLDSVQMVQLRNPNQNVDALYTSKLNNINKIQQDFTTATNNMLVQEFIKASKRTLSKKPFKQVNDYVSFTKNTFFNSIDFTNKKLFNSPFLVDRITDYIFYLNYARDAKTQDNLFKNAATEVILKINDNIFKKDIITFLIEQFEKRKKLAIVDFLIKEHYEKLPQGLQNKKFLTETKAKLAAEVGRIAPNFSWKENGEKIDLTTLNTANQYLLVFYSTSCSHCLKELPQLFEAMKSKKNVKVIAFALEKTDFTWNNYQKNYPGWYHVLGLNKWENITARTYQIFATPSYFILDKNKKIIAKPDAIKDVKAFFKS